MTAGQNIKAAREAAGISQTELAERIGTTRQQIGKYESGNQDMTLNRLVQIAVALGVDPDELININMKQREDTKMKMDEAKSRTWTKLAEIKTTEKTLMGIYKAIRDEFDANLYEDVLDVADAINEGYIQICEDGIIIWMA